MLAPCRHREEGATLIELMIVLAIAAIVGGVAVTSLVTGLRASASAQDRIDSFNQVQVALERMSRELRAADPVVEATASRIAVDVIRDGGCTRFTYDLQGTDLEVTRQARGDVSCSTNGAISTTALLTRVVNPPGTPVFSYSTSEGDAAAGIDDIEVIEITVVRELRRDPDATVQTLVHVRNSRQVEP